MGLSRTLKASPDATAGPSVPPSLFLGLAIASIGGPLALSALYLPGAGDPRSAGVFALVGAALYALPLAVWVRYSEEIVSCGGLAAFVEAAVGRPAALAQAGIWAFSYFLYLPYTVTDVVYEQLGEVFPGLEPWRPLLEVALPVAIVAFVLLQKATVLGVLLASAVVQLALVLVLGFVMLRHAGSSLSSFTTVPDARHLLRGGANVSLLFLCGSLPIFLGAEVTGGSRVVRRSLITAAAIVSGYVIFAAWPLGSVDPALTHAALPGYAIASELSGRALGIAVGVGISVSVTGLIVAEYLALSRLLHAVTRVPVRRLLLWIGVPFVAIDALGLIDPDEFDEQVLRPSLVALFLSELIVFAVFPTYRARRGRLTPVDVLVAVGAFVLVGWGLYRALFEGVAS